MEEDMLCWILCIGDSKLIEWDRPRADGNELA